MPNKPVIKVGIVDDHNLMRAALSYLISQHQYKKNDHRYEVTFQANNGKDMITKLSDGHPPDLMLIDINMPEMDGYETAAWLSAYYPGIKMIAITMDEDDWSVIQMLRKGAKGYLTKDTREAELIQALDALVNWGYYYSETLVKKLLQVSAPSAARQQEADGQPGLNEREVEFLRLIGTDLSYKEIAGRMGLSPRTIDGYRDTLFVKLNVRTRIGLLMYAMKYGICPVKTDHFFNLG